MLRKRILATSVLSLLFIGVGFSSKLLVDSWSMPANAGEKLIRFDTDNLQEKPYAIIKGNFEGAFGHSYLILKDKGELSVFLLLTRENSYLMPWKYHFWDASGFCKNLQVDEQMIFCEDKDIYDWQKEGWRWNLKGESLSGEFGALEVIDYAYEGRFIAIGKSSR
ncbi:hypothetical protein ACG1BZ_10600 [Microbulbifer sp. CNSA002]|uniref:hypothetical protein n=1 Tax=unclassified Microbulbifer TaxID=2619833 RepID=UPI0039B6E75B